MNSIKVSASQSYQVLVGQHLLWDAAKHISKVKEVCKTAIISDSNVWPLYGNTLIDSLQSEGFSISQYVIPAGESSKNGSTYLEILNFLTQNQITRSDLLIALGGGVVGDITGFAAATFLRGVAYVQIPTSLLAMVDSSVGGKTAIDLPAGKNLAGAFYQPKLVICDVDVLNTLPQQVFQDGCAEVIKYGILYDPELFEHLYCYGLNFHREAVISRCIELKRDVVALDEFDRGERQMLNLGHTIGHGIEAQSNFLISHGSAVAIGMAIVSKAGNALGICDDNTYKQILDVIEKFGLPSSTNCSSESLFENALSDKKRSGNVVNLIVPQKIGKCIIRTTPVTELSSFIEAGL